jgi:hypothetical protein
MVQSLKAMPMNRVAAIHLMYSSSTREKVFEAYGTICFVLIFLAIMVVNYVLEDTHVTVRAMLIGRLAFPSQATESTIITVERMVLFRHPQVTNRTMIFSKGHFAICTLVPISIFDNF